MFDFIRDLRRSAEEKRQETLAAYLDGALTPVERRRFEQRLAEDEALRLELAQLRWIKETVSRLPHARAPRRFTLDPALYGRPQPDLTIRLYPALRTATLLATFVFIIALAAQVIIGLSGREKTIDQASGEVAMEAAHAMAESEQPVVAESMAPPAGPTMAAVEVESEARGEEPAAVEEAIAEAPAEAPAEEPAAEEEVVAEAAEAMEAPAPLMAEASKTADEGVTPEVVQILPPAPSEPRQQTPAGGGIDDGVATDQVDNLVPLPAITPTLTGDVTDELFAGATPIETGELVAEGGPTSTSRPEAREVALEDVRGTAREEPQFLGSILWLLVIGAGLLVVILALATVIIGRRIR